MTPLELLDSLHTIALRHDGQIDPAKPELEDFFRQLAGTIDHQQAISLLTVALAIETFGVVAFASGLAKESASVGPAPNS